MIIKVGSSGTAVSKIQHKVGEKPDSIFGKGTEANVKAWQEANGVDADGIVGPGTWKKCLVVLWTILPLSVLSFIL